MRLARRHLRFGWWSLLSFLTLGIALEAMHGLKVQWYLDVSNETQIQDALSLSSIHCDALAWASILFSSGCDCN